MKVGVNTQECLFCQHTLVKAYASLHLQATWQRKTRKSTQRVDDLGNRGLPKWQQNPNRGFHTRHIAHSFEA